MALIDKSLISQIKKILLKSDRLASQILAGEYKSAFKGTGLNFDSIREYQYGDEIKNIDWKVTARMQEPFIREYKEERQITMMLIADLSSSNNFGSSEKSKKELIIEIASVLAFLAIKNNDKVGMMIVTDHVEYLIKPKQGKAHIFKLIKDLITFKPESKKTDIKNVLSEAIKIIPKHSIVFYLSDFIDDNSFSNSPKSLAYEQELKILRKIQDLILISIRDRREYKLPNLGFMEINNPESGIKELLNLNKKSVREKFLEKQKKYQNKIKESYKKIGIDFLEITTNKAYINDLLKLFLRREKRNH
ncbi:MAG: DUF58 domain-containing protein [Candidatus Caenarcaniphilales bacterium]|nr:DUF58 domain-containing protein [Candidatus Caenarcaniphilales bacterium]